MGKIRNRPEWQTGENEANLIAVLKKMLDDDITITARAVAKLHPSISAASSITRHPIRMSLLSEYQARQIEFRSWSKRIKKSSKANINMLLESQSKTIKDLENKLGTLTISHVNMIRAIGELGGFTKWSRFFQDYKEIRDQLYTMDALPNADVNPIKAPER